MNELKWECYAEAVAVAALSVMAEYVSRLDGNGSVMSTTDLVNRAVAILVAQRIEFMRETLKCGDDDINAFRNRLMSNFKTLSVVRFNG
jgi:hypothetical protein